MQADPVRWLLADEVGLGKTVEACLILSALLRTGRAERALVVAPSTLAVQWLGELYRKFHQVFVLLDHARLDSVETDFGKGVNPFDVHPFAVLPLELAASDQRLLRFAAEARSSTWWWSTKPTGSFAAEYADALRQLVLLTRATRCSSPRRRCRRIDRGFYELLVAAPAAGSSRTLRPSIRALAERQAAGCRAPVLGQACRRGRSCRRASRVPVDARGPARCRYGRWRGLARRTPARVGWCEQVPVWTAAKEKCLVFVRDLEVPDGAHGASSRARRRRVSRCFTRGSPTAKRDIEVAAFRESAVPLLISTEAGGEGRNFQFCHRMLHFDLPWDPVELEQRIGRLDRIGRTLPVEILYFRQSSDDGSSDTQRPPAVAQPLRKRSTSSNVPGAGLDTRSGRGSRRAARGSQRAGHRLTWTPWSARVEAAHADPSMSTSPRSSTPDAYRAEQADDDPRSWCRTDLERMKVQEFCVEAARGSGLRMCLEKGGDGAVLHRVRLQARRSMRCRGSREDSRFLGTFDSRVKPWRKKRSTSSPVDTRWWRGLLLELEDGNRGRAALLELPAGTVATGLVCVYKKGPEWHLSIVDADGTPRPEWSETFLRALPRARRARPEQWGISEQWADGLRALADRARGEGEIVAAAFFRPSGSRKR